MNSTDVDQLLEVTGSSANFAQSLYDGWQAFGSFTPKQEPYARKLIRSTGHEISDEVIKVATADVDTLRPKDDPKSQQAEVLAGIGKALEDGASVIGLTGAAGTGKTTLIEWLRYMGVKEFEMPVLIGATTHPAAAVLRSKNMPEAETIHALAGLAPHSDGTRGYRSIKPADFRKNCLLIIDESSMADERLIDAVSKKLKPFGESCLILVGDESQLPPVDGGAMFTRHLRHLNAPVFELTELIRQSPDGSLAGVLKGYRLDSDAPATDWPELMADEGTGERIDYGDPETVLGDFFLRQTAPHEVDGKLGPHFLRDKDGVDTPVLEACVVAYTNTRVNALNRRGREMQFGAERAKAEPFIVGERLQANKSVIDVKAGKTTLENGYIGTVTQVEPGPHANTYWVRLDERDRVLCPVGFASDLLLGELKDKADACAALFEETCLELFGRAAWQEFVKDRSREAVDRMLRGSDVETVELVKEFDLDRRKSWAQYKEVETSLADLRPLFARTVHKSQGMTCRSVIVDTASVDIARDDWRALVYVALSRAQKEVILI